MGDIFDSLFSLLPVVLAIIWILRVVNRRSSKGDGGTGRAPSSGKRKNVPPGENAAVRRREAGPGHIRSSGDAAERQTDGEGRSRTARQTLNAVMDRISQLAEGTPEPAPGTASPELHGEEALYEKMESRRIEVSVPPRVAKTTPEPKHSILTRQEDSGRPTPSDSDGYGKEGSLERISRLPPLARGMIWSMILDEPVGTKEPRH